MSLTELRPFSTQRVWTADEIPILTAQLSLPEFPAKDTRTARRFSRYYQLQQRVWLRYCEHWLLPQAETEYHSALAASRPLPCLQAELDYTVTYQEGSLLSLYTQSREPTPSGRRLLIRRGDTWDLKTGYPLPSAAFFPPRSSWKKQLLAFAESEIKRQEALGIARYHDDLRRRLRKSFNPMNYYLTAEGLVFFFPMLSIAPAAEGIPAFTVPYGQFGLRLPAKTEPPF